MGFYPLRSFLIVANTGNLTTAAISTHIKILEEEFKTNLFIRSSKGMTLINKGELLLKKAETTLNSAIDMVNLAAENQNEIIGEFKLSINQQAPQLNIAPLYQNISDNCQGISLCVSTTTTGKTSSITKTSKYTATIGFHSQFIFCC